MSHPEGCPFDRILAVCVGEVCERTVLHVGDMLC